MRRLGAVALIAACMSITSAIAQEAEPAEEPWTLEALEDAGIIHIGRILPRHSHVDTKTVVTIADLRLIKPVEEPTEKPRDPAQTRSNAPSH